MEVDVNINGLLDFENANDTCCDPNVYFYELAECDFGDLIKARGEDYYNRGKVLSVVRDNNNNLFKATVEGSYDKHYEVNIEYDLEEDYEYIECNCTCPCDFPCKHSYAVLLAIRDGKYETLNLKERIYKKTYSFYEVLKDIPANKIKEYLLSKDGRENVKFDTNSFEKNFIKYVPVQSYEYYYNNLYNDVVLELTGKDTLDNYFNLIVDYFSSQMYEEVFKIMKAIIEVYCDTDNLYSKFFIVELFPKLSMFIRVVSKNCSQDLKDELVDWAEHIKRENYYDSIFLQDVVEGIN